MNYIKDMNAFFDWLETNQLDSTTQLLWFHLMGIANKSGWPEWFTVANITLQAKIGISENTLIKHRNYLKQFGRIDYISQGKKKAGKYHIIHFAALFEVNYAAKCEVNHEVNSEVIPSALFKEELIKLKDNACDPPIPKDEDTVPEKTNPSNDLLEAEVLKKAAEVEKHFCQKRAKGFNVNSIDFQLIREIMAYGISIESAKSSIDNCFAEYKPKHPRDSISTFSYCVSRCYDDWEKQIAKLKPVVSRGDPPDERKFKRVNKGLMNKPHLPIVDHTKPVTPMSEERRAELRRKAMLLDGM